MKNLSLKEMRKIAKEYDIKLIYDRSNIDGGSCADNTIWINRSTKQWIKEISFWHELGHMVFSKNNMKNRKTYMSTVSTEGMAWEVGLSEASKYDRQWDYNSKEMKWAREQLASYINGEYDDLKDFYKKRKNND